MKKTLALLALAVVTTTAQASSPAPAPSGKGVIAPTIEPEAAISYTNISLSKQILSGNFILGDLDSDGIALGLEYSPVENLYVAAAGSYNEVELTGPVDLNLGDYWTGNVGVGGYIPLTGNIHFVTELGANYADVFNVQNEFGFYVTPHVRAKLGKLETHLGASYSSNELSINEFSAFLRLLYEVTPDLDLFVAGTLGLTDSTFVEDLVGVNFGLRLKF
jgi:hypothetical protein